MRQLKVDGSVRGKKSTPAEEADAAGMARRNSSGQMVMPTPAWAMARVVTVFSVSRISLGLK